MNIKKCVKLIEKQKIDFDENDLKFLTYQNKKWDSLSLRNKKQVIRMLSNILCKKIGIPIVPVRFREKLKNEDAEGTCEFRSHRLNYGLFSIPLYKRITTSYKKDSLTHNFSHNLELVMHELRHAVYGNVFKSVSKKEKCDKLIENLNNPFLQETMKNYIYSDPVIKPNGKIKKILRPKEIDADGFSCKNLWDLYGMVKDEKFKKQLANCTIKRLDTQYRIFEAEKNNLRDDLIGLTESNLIMNLCGFKPEKAKVPVKSKIDQASTKVIVPIENTVVKKANNIEK